jgi:hypothetical protein
MPDVHRELGRRRAGDQIRGSQEADEGRVVEPGPAPDELVAHQRDVGRRTAERRQAEAKEAGGKADEP